MPSIQGPQFYPGDEPFAMPLERPANSNPFTGQPYLPPNEPTEVPFIPVMPHCLPHTFPTPSQPDLNAQTVNSHALALTPQSPNQPLPLPIEIYMRDCSSSTGSGNIPTLAAPLVADRLHTKSMIDPRGTIRGRGRATALCRSTMKGSERAGPLAGTQNIQLCCCGWQNEDGSRCGASVSRCNCAGHFAEAHGIKNMAADVEVLCRWCPLGAKNVVIRHNFLRHLKEVHLRCPRLNKQDS